MQLIKQYYNSIFTSQYWRENRHDHLGFCKNYEDLKWSLGLTLFFSNISFKNAKNVLNTLSIDSAKTKSMFLKKVKN